MSGRTLGLRADVVILGGGPAGTGTALALRRHDPSLSVVVVESSDYHAPRIGETLPPPTRRLLEHLGVWQGFRQQGHAPSPGTAAAWGEAEIHENDHLFRTDGEGWHLDRTRFDAFLAGEAEAAGAELRKGWTFVDAEPLEQGGWGLGLRRRGAREVGTTTGSTTGTERLDARFVVDATGRRATFARRRGVGRQVFDDLLGLYVFYRSAEPIPGVRRTLVEAWEEGWWYSAGLPADPESGEHRLVIACMADADRITELDLRRREAWLGALESSVHTRRLLSTAGLEPVQSAEGAEQDPICVPAQSQLLERASGEGWLAVGDAASTYDPLSSQGIFKALRTATWAAYAISDHLSGPAEGAPLEKYDRRIAHDYEGYLLSRADYYRQEVRWPVAPFWHRRADHLTLDPRARLRLATDPASVSSGGSRLPGTELEYLRQLCRRPRSAHELVTALRDGSRRPISDQRLVLALQNLVERGMLVAEQDPHPAAP
jgi:flavin-dependent dehydrogenase